MSSDENPNAGCWKNFLPAVFGTVAVIMGTAGNLYCETVAFPALETNTILYAGVWSYRTKDASELGLTDDVTSLVFPQSCTNYNVLRKDFGFDYDKDAKARTTMAFSILATLIGGLTVVQSYLLPLCTTSPSSWKCMGILFLLACVCQGLTMIILQSTFCLDNPVLQYLESTEQESLAAAFPAACEKAAGFNLSLAAIIFWFLAGACTWVIPPPVVERRELAQQQTVTYQRNPDGTVQETNVTVVKGAAVTQQQEAPSNDEIYEK